jgi:motility quorum-sensing regulator/GCU-specific mRNA interferase toxin
MVTWRNGRRIVSWRSSRPWSRRARSAPPFRRSPAARLWGSVSKEIIGVVAALTPSDFYKSMTTHADHRVWQDVYRPKTPAGEVYLKLTVLDDVLIVSFKEL